MKKNSGLNLIYSLSMLGDLNLTILLTSSVLYGLVLGAEESHIGFIGGAYGVSYIIMAALLGRLGDKMPRKTSLIIASLGQISVTFFTLFIANSVIDLIISQALMGVFNGFFWPSIEAFISENTKFSVEAHQKGISNFCLSWSVGFTLGPLIAGILSDIYFKITFLITLITYSLMFFIILFGLPMLKDHKNDNLEIKNHNEVNSIESKPFIQIILTVFIYASISKLLLSFFTDYAGRDEGLLWNGTEIGTVLFMFGLGRTLYFLLARFFESRFRSKPKNSNYAILLICVTLFLSAFIRFLGGLLVTFLILGICCGLIYLSSLELLMNQEEKAKGAKAGLFESAVGFGSFSPIIAGFFAEINIILPFFIFSGIAISIYAINIVLMKQFK